MEKIKRLVFLCMSVLFVFVGVRIVNFFVFRPVDAKVVSIDTTDIEKVHIITYQYNFYGLDLTESIMRINMHERMGDIVRIRVNPLNPPEMFDTFKLTLQSLGFLCFFIIWKLMRLRDRRRGESYRLGFTDLINISRFPERFEADNC